MISTDSLISEFAAGSLVKTQDHAPRSAQTGHPTAEPKTSFFRGVIIGLAVAVPVWAWIITSIV